MKNLRRINLLLFLSLVFISCGGGGIAGEFPMQKKYWTPADYDAVNDELTSLRYNDKELPSLDNPETALVFRKITDTSNFSVVANDDQLGVEHRKEVTSKFFDQYRQLVDVYSGRDRTDKYKYPLELIEIEKFGLALQVYYIGMGNRNIIKTADDPNSPEVVNIVRRNKNILISNYNLYIENSNYEDRFNEAALISYSAGLKDFFPRLINDIAPDGDYSDMLTKVENMLKKSKNDLVIAQLQNIQNLIKNKTSS